MKEFEGRGMRWARGGDVDCDMEVLEMIGLGDCGWAQNGVRLGRIMGV